MRQAGAVAALRELLGLTDGEPVPGPIAAAADRLAGVAERVDIAGRTLGASNAALPVPAEPLARLWHAATVLREHRGDGHIAALVAADIDGPRRSSCGLAPTSCRSGRNGSASGIVSASASAGRAQMQPARGWTDDEWDAAASRLLGRGLLQPDGAATAAGKELHRSIEAATDQAAARPWARLPGTEADELADLLLPIARACAAVLPFPNPVGVPAPVAASIEPMTTGAGVTRSSVRHLADLANPAVLPDPYPVLAGLRAASPFAEFDGAFVVVGRHADCSAVLRDPRASSQRDKSLVAQRGPRRRRERPSFLSLDPPDHTRLRRLVSKAFTRADHRSA